MKKCTLILMVVLTIAACKKEKADSLVTKTNGDDIIKKCDSLTLDEYMKLSDIWKKKEWLKKHGDSVCRKILDSTVLAVHEVNGTVSNQKGTYTISWKNLKDTIKDHGYDAYLNVTVDTIKEKIDSLSMVPNYTDGKYCFSTALIRSLAKKYAKGDYNAKFQFSLAKVNNKSKRLMETVVVIQVDGAPYYYDYSTEPPFISTDNKPL